ncbi:hypothetical protein GCWU000325_00312 [Alloprevotella tannerae ATCC 51259]|uniref:Uncharacterized protein n=1 Tax=Alloprevotella tannerae ATCC 51259 TaxID=626522 RepID=C9LDN9_9BACT|nr:hypothetical protein GCWU000325_00312 [Alloprevotella tannerae ATCC 51259]
MRQRCGARTVGSVLSYTHCLLTKRAFYTYRQQTSARPKSAGGVCAHDNKGLRS